MIKKTCSWILSVITLVAIVSPVFAKDMTHRLGVGFKNNTAEDIPSLAVVYYPARDYALTGGFGLNSQKSYNSLQIHVGIRKMIYFENNLNFYMGGQLGALSYETPAVGKKNGVELLAVAGTEFFFTGLENLGFTLEAGLGLATAGDTRFRTVADSPMRAGIIFYF